MKIEEAKQVCKVLEDYVRKTPTGTLPTSKLMFMVRVKLKLQDLDFCRLTAFPPEVIENLLVNWESMLYKPFHLIYKNCENYCEKHGLKIDEKVANFWQAYTVVKHASGKKM